MGERYKPHEIGICDYGAILDLATEIKSGDIIAYKNEKVQQKDGSYEWEEKQVTLDGKDSGIEELRQILKFDNTDDQTCDTRIETKLKLNKNVKDLVNNIAESDFTDTRMYENPGVMTAVTLYHRLRKGEKAAQGGRRKLRKTSKKTSKKKTSKKRKTSRRKGRK